MTSGTYQTPYCEAPMLHDPHGFIITNNRIAYTVTCPGRKPTPHGGPQGIAGAGGRGSSASTIVKGGGSGTAGAGGTSTKGSGNGGA